MCPGSMHALELIFCSTPQTLNILSVSGIHEMSAMVDGVMNIVLNSAMFGMPTTDPS